LTNKTPDDPKNEVDDYNDLPPEQKETYESLGDEINQYYENIYAKELNS
jgi:hypothetical protein